MLVRELLVRSPVTVDAAVTVRDAARTMSSDGVGALVVTDHGRPVGVVTDRDLVVRGVAKDVPVDARVDAVMTIGVVSVAADADAADLVEAFGRDAVRRVAVVEGDAVVGLVSLDDMMIRLTGQLADLTRGLTAQVLFPHARDGASPPAVG